MARNASAYQPKTRSRRRWPRAELLLGSAAVGGAGRREDVGMSRWLGWLVATALAVAGCDGEVRKYVLPLGAGDAGMAAVTEPGAAATPAPGELAFDPSGPAPLGAACTHQRGRVRQRLLRGRRLLQEFLRYRVQPL